jgi:hypothetical protein
MDPVPDPAIFGLDLQAANKKLPVFFSKFFSLLLLGGIRTSTPDPDPGGQKTYLRIHNTKRATKQQSTGCTYMLSKS